MNEHRLARGEIVDLPSTDPSMKKTMTIRDDFLQIGIAQGATIDEYGSALVGALAALVYASARGDVVERSKLTAMVVEGIQRHFAIYDRAGGIGEARRRHLEVLARHG